MSLYGAIDKKYFGKYVATDADATATFATIQTGVIHAQHLNVTIQRATSFGPSVEVDAVCNYTGSTGALVVADGAATFDLAAGDIIYWTAIPPDESV